MDPLSSTVLYTLVQVAQAKITNEAARPEPNLRQLICHAHLIESLMRELSATQPESNNILCQNKAEGEEIANSDSDSDSSSDSDSDLEVDIFYVRAFLKFVKATLIRIPGNARHYVNEPIDIGKGDRMKHLAEPGRIKKRHIYSSEPPELGYDSSNLDDAQTPPLPQAIKISVEEFKEETEELFCHGDFLNPSKSPTR
ncbi:hypothetical protein BGZ63DRAFT_379337 [Mariannaea sp. PMI_226]|nr:hypothetical protein BGZ63DRAFT_379337 [Mariannaea sp. PMI_226]